MPGFLSFVRVQYTDLPLPQPPSNISGGTYVVTGANTGLGFECAKHLFQMGAGRIILAVRSREKGKAALDVIRRETGRQGVGEVWELDLMSLESVEIFSKRLGTLERVDGLIANAGVVMTQFQTIEGVESSLLVNVVSTMLLAFRALPKLQESARRFDIQPRLVIVTSNSALDNDMKMRVEKLQGDVFDALSTEKGFNTFTQYPTTKLLEIYAVRELASLLPVSDTGVIINTVNPGLCYSSLDRNGTFMLRMMMAVMRALLARSTEKGSRNLLQAAFAGPDSHGTYCSECQIRDNVVPAWITDKAGKGTQERVWKDLLKRLDSTGHSIDLTALKAEKKGGVKI
ncbi:hypothetical protein QQX98_002558 [Neonectria punicea]|uniref:Ketoreductase domain-containing protein n=1 Tax=Neonectria punicea TaxID=979145 RepID=A0ABR1HIS0_9HYPO